MAKTRRSATPARPSASTQGIDALGPSDTSDSGSDVQGERGMMTAPDNPGEWGALPVDTATDSDAAGTGERGAATGPTVRDGADILPDGLRSVDELVADDADADPDGDADAAVHSDGAAAPRRPPAVPRRR